MNPFNQNSNVGDSLVTKMIGSAFDIVRCVADNIAYVQRVAVNMTAVRAAANNLSRGLVTITGNVAGARGETVNIDLPDEIEDADVLDYSIILVGSDSSLYSGEQRYFVSKITDGVLYLTLAVDAPVALEGADIRWTLSYRN